MSVESMGQLEIFCLNEACGDPVANAGGRRSKRRMNYAGLGWTGHIYKCPICGRERKFVERLIFGGFYEVT